MSRREERESDTKRLRSSLEREPSPKRSRRDGKPKTERNTTRSYDLDTLHNNDPDQKRRRRLQDALPLEAPAEPESKAVSDTAQIELKKKTNEKDADSTKRFSDLTEVPRAPLFFQHDERGNPGQGRSFGRRGTADRGRWTDKKYRADERPRGNGTDSRNSRRDERTQTGEEEYNEWRHDRYHELEADAPPSTRKRPAFKEKKIEQESEDTAGISATESGRSSRIERSLSENGRREERGGRRFPVSDRIQRPLVGDRGPPLRRETQKIGFSSRERLGGSGRFLDRVGYSGGYRDRNQNDSGPWKHDLFDEANKSPSPKNTEDQIAKVEALLAL